jgi:hypothetical protein
VVDYRRGSRFVVGNEGRKNDALRILEFDKLTVKSAKSCGGANLMTVDMVAEQLRFGTDDF